MVRIKTFLKGFFAVFGFTVFLYTAGIQIVNSHNYSIKFIWSLALMLFVNMLFGSLIFKKGLSKKALWVRRIIIVGVACITTPGSVILFGVLDFDRFSCLTYVGITVAAIIVLSIITYFVADEIERKNIEKINAKLKDN